MDLDEVQSNRNELIATIKMLVEDAVDDWGIEVTRAEILDVNLDQATRDAMLQQLNAERARRAQVTEAEGQKRAVELNADAELYAAETDRQGPAACRPMPRPTPPVSLPPPSPRTGSRPPQYQVALKQVEALNAMGNSPSSSTIVVPANALEAFGNAFNMLKGKA